MGETDYKLSKVDFKVLEKIFTAEIDRRLPAQLRSKELPRLERQGLISPMRRTFGRGAFAVIVSGWELTERGRFLYCQACADEKGSEANG